MSHNTDIADGWEREGEDVEFFHRFFDRCVRRRVRRPHLRDVTLIRLLPVPTSQRSALNE